MGNIMGFGRFFQGSAPTTSSSNDRQAQQSCPDPQMPYPGDENHHQYQEYRTSPADPLSSPDPLNAPTAYRQFRPYQFDEIHHHDQFNDSHFEPFENTGRSTRSKTRPSCNNKPTKNQHETPEQLLDVHSTESASHPCFEALAAAHKTIESLTTELDNQRVSKENISVEARGAIENWQQEYGFVADRVYRRDITIRELRGIIDRYETELGAHKAREKEYQGRKEAFREQLECQKSRLRDCKSENQNLQKNLEDCKERIFRSQPFQGQTDTALLNNYMNLCDSIDKWVYKNLVDGENNVERLLDVQSHSGGPFGLRQIFNRDEIAAIHRFPSIGNVMMSAFVMRALCIGFLQRDFARYGLDAVTNDVLDGIVAALQKLEPAKAVEDCQSWRVDLHRALNLSCEARGNKLKALNELHIRILRSAEIVGVADEPVEEIRLECHAVLQEAATLAEGINFSMSAYEFCMAPLRVGETISMEDLKKYNVVDSSTGAVLRPKSSPVQDLTGRVGEMVCDVFPAFYRRGGGSMGDVELCKGTIVVQFDVPVPPVGRKKTTC